MNTLGMPGNAIAFTMWVMLLILNSIEAPAIPQYFKEDADEDNTLVALAKNLDKGLLDAETEIIATLHHFHLCLACNFLNNDLGIWV
ncbi:hypothetical protein M758_UG243200 [Ceratodon purpureus]|nr:hypothetical protein M758_UG243200 [Ceratodon purpureus]